MKTTRHIIFTFLFLFIGTGISLAYSPTEIITKDPNTESKINKLLIIVLLRTNDQRVTLEDELGYDLGDYGISTVSSHLTALAGSERLNHAEIRKVCDKHNADGVLVVRLVDAEAENSYSYNQRSQYTGAGFTSANSSGVVIGGGKAYSWGDYAYGNYFDAVSSNRIEVQSDIYHVGDDKQLMTDDVIMRVDPMEEEKAIEKFAKKLSKKVSKQKYIVREK